MNGKEIPDRVFYRIKEVCNLTGLKPHVLRYWEQEFKDIRPVKSPTGQRLYKRRTSTLYSLSRNCSTKKGSPSTEQNNIWQTTRKF